MKKNTQDIVYIDRSTNKQIKEEVPAASMLNWLYSNPFGKIAKNTLIKRAFISRLYGYYCDLSISKKKILPFIKQYKIDQSEFLNSTSSFKNFNNFFIRKLKPDARIFDLDKNIISSPCDGKVLGFNSIKDIPNFFIKGQEYTTEKLIQKKLLSDKFKTSSMLLFRLAPVDYHRYHFPINSKILDAYNVEGALNSVSPLALKNKFDIFLENKRNITLLSSDKIGEYLFIEIGATMVGSIVGTNKNKIVKKGDEKGYFKFGGSSIILLFNDEKIKIDDDIINNTQNLFETSIKAGQHVATII